MAQADVPAKLAGLYGILMPRPLNLYIFNIFQGRFLSRTYMPFESIFPPNFFTGRMRDHVDPKNSVGRRWIITFVRHSYQPCGWRPKLMDIIVLAIGFGFFALMFGYISVCEKL